MNRRHFLSLAPLILMPEPVRAYSFLWETPRDVALMNYEQALAMAAGLIRKHFETYISAPAVAHRKVLFDEGQLDLMIRGQRADVRVMLVPRDITVTL